ncbi:hypothetical protein MHYP_G00045690 [Metynnis hypsauchen]
MAALDQHVQVLLENPEDSAEKAFKPSGSPFNGHVTSVRLELLHVRCSSSRLYSDKSRLLRYDWLTVCGTLRSDWLIQRISCVCELLSQSSRARLWLVGKRAGKARAVRRAGKMLREGGRLKRAEHTSSSFIAVARAAGKVVGSPASPAQDEAAGKTGRVVISLGKSSASGQRGWDFPALM